MIKRAGFPLNRIDEITQRPEDFRLLERIPFNRELIAGRLPLKLHEVEEGERLHAVVFLDTETTGMRAGTDKIIELGLVKVTYSFDRKIILSIDKTYNAFEDPGMKIPDEITNLTGITDAMVQGERIDDDEVAMMLSGRPLIAAHNAAFDRPFFEQRFPSLADFSWACSNQGINWDILGSRGRKLEYLTCMRGWFYEAHRAEDDCLALVWLLHIEPEAFAMLIEGALKKEYLIYAWGSPFEVKDTLKSMGYRFDGKKKVWYRFCSSESEVSQQLSLLGQHYDASQAETVVLTARNRFKKLS